MDKFAFFLYIALISVAFLELSEGHGRLLKPPSRSSVWRIPEFNRHNPPKNYDDHALYCGGIHQKDNPGSNCGVCGDPISQRRPRDNENGGRYAKNIITGNYRAGQVIQVEVELTQEHKGFMEWRLCTDKNSESQSCFNRHLLQVAGGGSGSKVYVNRSGSYKVNLRLPSGVRCNHCVIQWNYRAGNNWGWCDDGSGRVGCGPQETFRGCADVRIQ